MESDFSSESSDGSGGLSLSCSFSSVEWVDLEQESEESGATIEPSMYEPHAIEEPSSISDDDDSPDEQRLLNTDWCQCGHFQVMPTSRECICCHEIDKVHQKMLDGESEVNCITNHEGFQPVCLNLWVLQAAYFTYRQRYGESPDKSDHEKYRFIAYYQLTSWC